MNKILLLAGAAMAICISDADASDLNQYFSAKVARSQIGNEASNKFLIKSGNDVVFKGTVADKTLKDDVWGIRLAYGLEKELPQFGGGVRAEFEYGLNSSANENGRFNFNAGHIQKPEIGDFSQKLNIMTIMMNVYYDYKFNESLRPYVGFGLGYAHLKTSGSVFMPISVWNTSYAATAKDREDNFAWNLAVGAGYKINEKITADLGYRYTDYGNIKNNSDTGNSKYNLNSHEVYLGARYAF